MRPAATIAVAVALYLGGRYALDLIYFLHEHFLQKTVPALSSWGWFEHDQGRLLFWALFLSVPLALLSALPLARGWGSQPKAGGTSGTRPLRNRTLFRSGLVPGGGRSLQRVRFLFYARAVRMRRLGQRNERYNAESNNHYRHSDPSYTSCCRSGKVPSPPARLPRRSAPPPPTSRKSTLNSSRPACCARTAAPKAASPSNNPPEKITLLHVVEACQGVILGDYCQKYDDLSVVCAFHKAMHELQASVMQTLEQWTIADLAEKPSPRQRPPRPRPMPHGMHLQAALSNAAPPAGQQIPRSGAAITRKNLGRLTEETAVRTMKFPSEAERGAKFVRTLILPTPTMGTVNLVSRAPCFSKNDRNNAMKTDCRSLILLLGVLTAGMALAGPASQAGPKFCNVLLHNQGDTSIEGLHRFIDAAKERALLPPMKLTILLNGHEEELMPTEQAFFRSLFDDGHEIAVELPEFRETRRKVARDRGRQHHGTRRPPLRRCQPGRTGKSGDSGIQGLPQCLRGRQFPCRVLRTFRTIGKGRPCFRIGRSGTRPSR